MRHETSVIMALEGLSRTAFHIAKELHQNSRSGLTLRFLSKKLELPEEEVEYLVELNRKLMFVDLTRVKLVAEGPAAVKRICDGLENHGDIPSLVRLIKGLGPHEFRRVEEMLRVDRTIGKQRGAEEFIERHYAHPESVVEYVASGNFSSTAREVFDLVWQSAGGIMPVNKLRAAHGGRDYEVELALADLVQGFALFEMFRFDPEDRLVRVVGLLSELRQWKETSAAQQADAGPLRPVRGKPAHVESRGLDLSDSICRLVGAIAARPVRLRSNGDLFREDERRLEDIRANAPVPSLATCLWMAQGVEWLVQVDNELRVSDLDALANLDRHSRHRALFKWVTAAGTEADSLRIIQSLMDEMKPATWYRTMDFIHHAMRVQAEHEQGVLRNTGGHWRYVSPSIAAHAERALARSLEEHFLWLGVVDRAELDGDGLFRITDVGRSLLLDTDPGTMGIPTSWQTEIIVQPNFDIVVASQGTDPLLTVPLDQFAVRSSTGQALVYRLTKESYTHAVQDGHDGDAFVAFLLKHNRGGSLPPNVMKTLEDWRGGMKRVQMRTLVVLEAEDPLVLADLMHRRRLKGYLHPLDPNHMVALSNVSKAEFVKELEKEGFVVG